MASGFRAEAAGGCIRLLSKEDKVLQELLIVPASDDHRNYILSTWVKSYAKEARRLSVGNGTESTKLSNTCYTTGESAIAEAHWNQTMVVVSPSDAFTVHGWVCASNGRLWHVYIPPDLRGRGMARALVEQAVGKVYTVSKPWPRTPRGHIVSWNPFTDV